MSPAHASQATVIDDEEVTAALVDVDPEPYADMAGGLKLFSAAIETLRGLSRDDLDAFVGLEK